MRLVKLAFASLLLLTGSYLYFALLHPPHRVEDHAFFQGTRPLVIAHQGGRGLWPENSLHAFENARALGADVLEMDLRGTADGHIVVIHDASVDRTTNGSGLVREMRLEEIRELDAGYRFQAPERGFLYRGRGLLIPTLAEVLAAFRDIRLNLEMKEFDTGLAASLCRQVRASGMAERVLVASFRHPPMVSFRQGCPEVATSATVREGLLFYHLNRVGLGSLFRSPAVAFELPERFGDIDMVESGLIARAQESNAHVQIWTVNEPDDMKRLLQLGVDGIVTDYPDRLLELVRSKESP